MKSNLDRPMFINELAAQQIKVQKEAEQKKGNFLGSLRIPNGCKLYQVHRKTKEVSEVEYKREPLHLDGHKAKKQLIIDADTYAYIVAINAKNALRKFKKRSI